MTLTRWYLGHGRSGATRYLLGLPASGAARWTDDAAEALRFDTKAEAVVVQLDLVAELGLTVACISDCPKARQQDEAQQQHRSSDLDYVRRAMTARHVRVGPGPDRDVVHGDG